MLSKEEQDGLKKLVFEKAEAVVAFHRRSGLSEQCMFAGGANEVAKSEKDDMGLDAQLDLMLDGLIATCVSIERILSANVDWLIAFITECPGDEETERKIANLRILVHGYVKATTAEEAVAVIKLLDGLRSLRKKD